MKDEKVILSDKMTVEEMAKEILLNIFQITENGIDVKFEGDLGKGSITVYIGDTHTHCGFPGATQDELIESIYNTLIGNKGLSFAHFHIANNGSVSINIL